MQYVGKVGLDALADRPSTLHLLLLEHVPGTLDVGIRLQFGIGLSELEAALVVPWYKVVEYKGEDSLVPILLLRSNKQKLDILLVLEV